MRNNRPRDIDVIILCGGLGTRLQSVIDDRPKPMAEINGAPFLDILIDYVASYGFTRFILCTGYGSDFIKRYYENKRTKLTVLISNEERPLGTAGAIKNGESLIESDIFLALNGDSLCEIDLRDFLRFHFEKRAFISIVLATMEMAMDYGVIKLDGDGQIIRFDEKILTDGNGLINAGVYLFDRRILEEIPSGQKQSLEYDLIPRILDKGIYGYVTEKGLLDIGTPERLEMARKYLREVKI